MMTGIGLLGAALMAGAYYLNSWNIVPSVGLGYQLMNFIGAALVCANLFSRRAWSDLAFSFVWLFIATAALVRIIPRLLW